MIVDIHARHLLNVEHTAEHRAMHTVKLAGKTLIPVAVAHIHVTSHGVHLGCATYTSDSTLDMGVQPRVTMCIGIGVTLGILDSYCLINKGNGIAYKSLYIQNFWHQQYEQGDYHGWHTHGDAIYSSVYYAELPEGSATTFRINGEERQFDVQEGDYIVFPSFIEHCSKPNNTGTRKTIVSLNLNPEG